MAKKNIYIFIWADKEAERNEGKGRGIMWKRGVEVGEGWWLACAVVDGEETDV